MTAGHLGYFFFPDVLIIRDLGRIVFPLFAFFIAEGCYHTHSQGRYLLIMAADALAYQLAFYLLTGSLWMCVLVTFCFSLIMIFSLKRAADDGSFKNIAVCAAVILAVWFVCEGLPDLMPGSGFGVDYGFYGAALPAVFYAPRLVLKKLFRNDDEALCRLCMVCAGAIWMIPLSLSMEPYQWWCLLSVPVLLLYNGKRGRANLKYFFYIYYPLHLGAIYLLLMLAGRSL